MAERDVVPIERGHEIRRERIVAWVQASIDAMTPTEQREIYEAIRFMAVVMSQEFLTHADR